MILKIAFLTSLILLLLVSRSKLRAQELISFEENLILLQQVNKFRVINRNLKYDSSRQSSVDKYAKSDQLLKYYRHSYGNNEVIAQGSDFQYFIVQWKMSPRHRRVLRGRKFRYMCARFVKYGDVHFGVIRFYESKVDP